LKTVFLTGATGFVGSYLLQNLLAKGYKVRALRRKNSPLHLVAPWADAVEWVTGDIDDEAFLEESLSGVQAIYHSAAFISYQPKDAEQMLQVNANGTANLVNAALYAGVERFLYVSSIAALGRKQHQTHYDENSQWENNSLNSNYAISKFKGECEVWRGMEEGLSAVIVNPSIIVGAGYWSVAAGQFFRRFSTRRWLYPRGGSGFVDVRDVAAASVALMETNIQNQRFILNAENWSYKKLFSQIAESLGQRPPNWEISDTLAGWAWRADMLKARILGVPPTLTRELAHSVQQTFTYDNQKILQSLPNFQFRPLAQTLEDTAKVFLESQKKGLGFGLF
jgi:dihydroflavonol-4-reductase